MSGAVVDPASVCDAHASYLALGHEVLEGPGARAVRDRARPWVYDANLLQHVRAASPAAIEETLRFAETVFAGLGHRQVIADPRTPACFVARLALDGYEPVPTLQLALAPDTPLAGPAPPAAVAIRAVGGEADWTTLRDLLRADHLEQALREGRPAWAERVSDEMAEVKRAKASGRGAPVRFWLARLEGRDAGFFSSWPGEAGTGLVEDLFTLPAVRRRGVARALVHHAVADARVRGAHTVVIGARPDDTPKAFYAALGFRPVCLTWAWRRTDLGGRGVARR